MHHDCPRQKKILAASFHYVAVISGGPSVDHTRHRTLIESHQRWFSSDVNPLVAEDTLEGRWKHATNKVLDSQAHPVGSFDTLTWQMCVSLLLWWVERGPEGVERSWTLLDRLVDEAAQKTTATTATSISKLGFQLDVYILHAVLKNWNQSLRSFKTDILPSTVLRRIDEYLERSDCLQPNIATYTMILDGASHCPMPQERLVFTERLLRRLIQDSETNPHLRPTVVTFGTAINAMAQSGSLTCAEKAEAMLRRLQELNSKDEHWLDVKPNAILYTSCIHAWAKAGIVHRAESLLKEMYEECTLHGNTDLKPNRRTFNTGTFSLILYKTLLGLCEYV
jgi:pentatricopeptide repeat protein